MWSIAGLLKCLSAERRENRVQSSACLRASSPVAHGGGGGGGSADVKSVYDKVDNGVGDGRDCHLFHVNPKRNYKYQIGSAA